MKTKPQLLILVSLLYQKVVFVRRAEKHHHCKAVYIRHCLKIYLHKNTGTAWSSNKYGETVKRTSLL